jgi:hypothetical protein
MNAKLTLTIEQDIIDRAKKYAKQKGHSLSSIIENYLKVVTKDQEFSEVETTPIVRSLRGSFKAPEGFDYKKELTKGLTKKYLNSEESTH